MVAGQQGGSACSSDQFTSSWAAFSGTIDVVVAHQIVDRVDLAGLLGLVDLDPLRVTEHYGLRRRRRRLHLGYDHRWQSAGLAGGTTVQIGAGRVT